MQGLFDLVDKVDSYRAGYTPEERIALEKVGLQFHLGVFFGMVCLLLNIWVHCTENNYVDKAQLFSSCDCFKLIVSMVHHAAFTTWAITGACYYQSVGAWH